MRALSALVLLASAALLNAQNSNPVAASAASPAQKQAAGMEASSKKPIAAWIELTGDGPSLRAIVAAEEPCPVAFAHGVKLRLEERAGLPAMDVAFPVKVCAVALPPATAEVHLGNQVLHSFAAQQPTLNRIVVIGDTGCRKTATEQQDCETDWPFARIVAFAAAQKPDLVIHVGDYYYRETCPNGEKHCETWENWRKDFFTPAAPLFAAAPWLLARGNHEMCGRASEGWFRFLDAGSTPLTCPKGVQTESVPFAVPFAGLTLVSVDSADTVDTEAIQTKMVQMTSQIAKAAPPAGNPVWIVTHKPPYEGGLAGKAAEISKDPELPLDGVQLVVVGHIHMFGAIDFAGARPAELIVGDSGTKLQALMAKLDAMMSRADPLSLVQGTLDVDGKPATFGAKGRFGYMLLEREGAHQGQWRGTLYGNANEVLARCTLSGRAIACLPPKS